MKIKDARARLDRFVNDAMDDFSEASYPEKARIVHYVVDMISLMYERSDEVVVSYLTAQALEVPVRSMMDERDRHGMKTKQYRAYRAEALSMLRAW